ncbi:MAG TPA: SRPBCC family protein [Glaciibacter sp.]|nr:SRPBCC family protein [Glaciibacter sp.]
MSTVNADIDVEVPISVAYNQWTQFESFPQFLSGIDEIQQLDDRRLHWKVSVAGVKREFDAEITEQVPDERIAWKSTGGEDHAGVVTFHRLSADSTRISVNMDWKPQGVVESVGALLQIDDIQIKKDLRTFKEKIESKGFETGSWRGSIDRAPDATGR